MPDRILYYTWSIRTMSPFAIPLFSSSVTSLAAVEEHLTSFVRNKTAGGEGTYATLAWIPLELESKHLHIDVRLQDEPVAQVLFCFPTFDDIQVKCFSFSMQRGGSKTLCDIVLQYFESTYGCVFSNRPFSPTPNQVAHSLAIWTTQQSASAKPLEVTFHAPDAIASAGLSKLSLTIPPVAIAQLLQDMQKHSAENEELPILRALQCYILETYNLRIESFALVRATSAAAMLGCDGRCKPLDRNLLESVLTQIQSMIATQLRIERHSDTEESIEAQDG